MNNDKWNEIYEKNKYLDTIFIDKYKDEGVIWYFDVFSMSAEDLYRTLLQFKNAGWFKYTNLIVFGPVCFPNSEYNLDYIDM